MSIQIDKDIPLPSQNGKWPFKDLQVGESFAFPKEKRNSINATSNSFGKTCNPKRKFITRNYSETEGRCWRIE